MMKEHLKNYAKNLAVAFDKLIVAFLGGHHLRTISGYLGEGEKLGCKYCYIICKFLSFIFRDKNHCIVAHRVENILLIRLKKLQGEKNGKLDKDCPKE